jgi:TetR/AcrR family transcriptional repressor of mexJK operon
MIKAIQPCPEPDPRIASRDGDDCGLDAMALRSPGRPKDLEKRESILDAAQALFAERGLDGVPIEAIAARSGVSKVTVYGHFGDKAKIFESIVQRETDRLTQQLSHARHGDGPLKERLISFGVALLDMLTQPCHLALDRSVSMESQRNPALGRRFFDAGPGRVLHLLTEILIDAQSQGQIALDSPDAAAKDLLALWLGFNAMERRFIGGCTLDEESCRAHITRAVLLFMKAYAPA